MKRKAQLGSVINILPYLVVSFIVIFFLFSVLTPTMFTRAVELYGESEEEINFTNATPTNMAGNNCVASTVTCVNTTGTESIASGNWTFTESTCTITIVNGSEYHGENATCTYNFETGAYGNVSTGIENIATESTTLVPVAFGIVALILIFLAIAVLRRQT